MRLHHLFENAFITDQPAFQRWFAGSKVVDSEGHPLKLYRGLRGDYIQTADRMEGRKGYSMFFSTSPYVAATYAMPFDDFLGSEPGGIFPVYVKATTLHEFPTQTRHGYRRFDMFDFDTVASRLRAGEGIVARHVVDIGPRARQDIDPERRFSFPSDIYAFGHGTQIKSAVSNSGAFDANNPTMID